MCHVACTNIVACIVRVIVQSEQVVQLLDELQNDDAGEVNQEEVFAGENYERRYEVGEAERAAVSTRGVMVVL